jgi:hypothetical protein
LANCSTIAKLQLEKPPKAEVRKAAPVLSLRRPLPCLVRLSHPPTHLRCWRT